MSEPWYQRMIETGFFEAGEGEQMRTGTLPHACFAGFPALGCPICSGEADRFHRGGLKATVDTALDRETVG